MLKNRNIYFTATFLVGLISLLMPNQALAQYQFDNSFNQNNYPPIGATYSRPSRTKKTVYSRSSSTKTTVRRSAFNQNRTVSAKIRKELLRRRLEAQLRQIRNIR